MPKQKERIHEIMTRGAFTVTPEDNVQKAVDLMAERNISCVVVTETAESMHPVGIITERDLIRRVLKTGKDPKRLKAKSVMTNSLVTISENASLEEGMRLLQDMRIRRIPVVNKEGVSGLVTQTDIVEETYNIHKHNQRLMFHQNIQSYVIIALAAFFVIVFIVKYFF